MPELMTDPKGAAPAARPYRRLRPSGGRAAGLPFGGVVVSIVLSWLALASAVAAVPPTPSQPSPSCDAQVGGQCFVNGSFSLWSYSSGAHHYRVCRSNDTSGWGGCDVVMSSNTGSSLAVTGSHLPSDGYRRAYRYSACDSAGACTPWADNPEAYVWMDLSDPSAPGNSSVACAHVDGADCWVAGSFFVSASAAYDGGSGVTGYRICRSKDTSSWGGCDADLVPVGSGGTSTSVSGSHLPSDGYRRAYYFQARDAVGNWGPWNSPRYVRVDRHNPSVSATNSSSQWFTSRTATVSAADAEGGAAANSGLDEVRVRWNASPHMDCLYGTLISPGTTLMVPEGDNTLYLCARDHTGRVDHWSGTYRLDSGPPTAPGPTTVACAHSTSTDCWVTGPFTASVTPATDEGSGVSGYRICRSQDTTGWGGCNADLVPVGSGGTSVSVDGSHLPADGYRRAYYFEARDAVGNWGPWNTPRYVRVDRHEPSVSASNSSSQWFTERTATVSAADATGGAGANSGLARVRHRWNAPLDGACTNGAATSAGAALAVPEGDNTLHLCARDATGRVRTWSGTYRVDATAPVLESLTVSDGFWSIGDGSTYQITARASDTGSGVRELRALINLKGSNSENRRGNFSWRDQSLGYLWTADRVPCTGGGYASKRPDAYNPETVTLVGCSTTRAGGQRTVVFTVRPEASFGEFGAINDITFWARDFVLNKTSWQNFDLNFSSGLRPPPAFEVRDGTGTPLGDGAALSWGTVDEGAGDGVLVESLTVTNVAPEGSANLLLEHEPTNLEIVGSTAFSTGGALVSPLAAGEADGFTVRLDTTRPGRHDAVLKIWHDDSSRPIPFEVDLTAEVLGEPAALETTPTIVRRGTSTTLTVTGENLGGASVSIATEPYEDGGPSPSAYPTAELLSVNSAGTELRATIHAQGEDLGGFYNLAIDTPGGGTAAPFRVVGPEPVIDVWTPSEPIAGRVHVLEVMGVNLLGADVVPQDPGVLVLDLDNGDDRSLSGLLFVSSSVPAGELDVRLDGAGGSTVLPMELQPDVLAAGVATHELEVGDVGRDGLRPDILLQDPVVAASPEALAAGIGAQPAPGSSPDAAGRKLTVVHIGIDCITFKHSRKLRFRAVLVSLLDDLGDPLAREAIDALLPGQSLDFTSLTVATEATLSLDFYFKVCWDGRTTLPYVCISGSVSVMVPGVGGWSATFDVCGGYSNRFTLTAGGSVGSHTYSTSNSCLVAHDLESPDAIVGQRRSELEMSCCDNATISLHTTGVAFDRAYELEGPVIHAEPECGSPSFLGLKLRSVSFLEDLTILRDQVGGSETVSDPVWSDADLNGFPEVEENPVAYVRGQTAHVVGRFAVDPVPLTPTTVRVRATGPTGFEFESGDLTVDSEELVVEMAATTALESYTQHLAPLELEWSFTTDGSNYKEVGRSRHEVFVTLAPPLPERDLTWTALTLGIPAGGAMSQSIAAQFAWNQFQGPAGVQTWDGRVLSYYPAGVERGQCAASSLGLLQSADGAGQCGAFAHLLMDALGVNGITANQILVKTVAEGERMLIDNWVFEPEQEASYPGESYPWKLELQLEFDNAVGMVPRPPGGVYGDLTSVQGIPGQNSPTPSQKAFVHHILVQVPALLGVSPPYLDPSYGTAFSGEQDFQDQVIAGFYRHFVEDPDPTVQRVRKPGAQVGVMFVPQ